MKKLVKGILIDPTKKTIEEVSYDGSHYHCVEHVLDIENVMGEPIFIEDDNHQIFYEFEPEKEGTPFVLRFDELSLNGKCLIVRVGNFENERDFHTLDIKSYVKSMIINGGVVWEDQFELHFS
jgi:hypothetical protein